MKKHLLLTISLFVPLLVSARELTVCNSNHQPLDSAVVTGFGAQMDSLTTYITATDGKVNVTLTAVKNVLVEHADYSTSLVYLPDFKGDSIFLDNGVNLKEVVITADAAQQFVTHDSYRIPQRAMEKYATFYDALNEIPNMVVIPQVGLFYEGSSGVKLLLNGVESSKEELATIAKSDVDKINVYHTPPVRFAGMGVTSVVDVITKSNLRGGNVGIDVSQSFFPVFGDNSVAAYYNYKRSRFSLLFNNSNRRDLDKERSEMLRYRFDGVDYEKERTTYDSDGKVDENNLTLSFQNNKQGSYLYNLRVGIAANRNYNTYLQDARTGGMEYNAENTLNTKSDQIFVSNHFEKNLGEDSRYGNMFVNIYYQRSSSRFFSNYKEFADVGSEEPTVDELTDYSTDVDALMGYLQYQFPMKKWGQLSFSASNTYKYSQYDDESSPFNQKSNSFNANLMYVKAVNKFTYILRGGVVGNYISSDLRAEDFNQWSPSAWARVDYNMSRNLRFRASYLFTLAMPTLAQLSETEQWLDTRLAFHGNPLLDPAKSHIVQISAIGKSKYIDGTIAVGYQISPDFICNQYVATPDYMLETIVNLDKYRSLSGSLSLTLKPLGNSDWIIYNNLSAATSKGEGPDYEWDGYTFRWSIGSNLYVKKWSFSAFYQYPGKREFGQIIRDSGETVVLGCDFRPMKGMTVGLSWMQPFNLTFKERERTVDTAPVYTDTKTILNGWSNMVRLRFSWNFSFGKNHNNARPRYNGGNDDTGVLQK